MQEDTFLNIIIPALVIIVVVIILILYLTPIFIFEIRYRFRKRGGSREDLEARSKKLNDDIQFFIQMHTIRPFLFSRRLQHISRVTYNEGYL